MVVLAIAWRVNGASAALPGIVSSAILTPLTGVANRAGAQISIFDEAI